MTAITWKRVPRQGFIASHWVGFDASGNAVFRMDQRKPASAGRRNNTRQVHVFRVPSGSVGVFPNVAAAKAAVANQ